MDSGVSDSLIGESLRRLEAAKEELRLEYPHGHPDFFDITMKELKLHSDKNHDYARGGEPLGNFKRVASILWNYPNLSMSDPRVVALIYALKQLDATLWMLNNNYDGAVEGMNSRLNDISVYSKLVMCMNNDEQGIDGEAGDTPVKEG